MRQTDQMKAGKHKG